MKRLILYASFFLCLPSLAHSWVLVTFYHSNDRKVVGAKVYCTMCGIHASDPVPKVNSNGYCTCHGWSVLLSTRGLGNNTACDGSDPDVGALNGRLNDYFDSLPSGAFPAIDIDGMAENFDPSSPMISYFPNGTVLTDPNGVRYAVTDSPDGENRFGVPFVNGVAQGYQGGSAGSYSLVAFGEGQYGSNFTPAWSGGVSESGSSSSLSVGGSSSSVVPFGGSPSSGSTVFDTPSTVLGTTESGDTYNIINVPSQTVPLENGSSITLYDYSSLLNAIGQNVSSGFNQLHDDNNVINENLRKQLETDDGVSVAENTDPQVDLSPAVAEAQEQLDLINQEGSGWRFDFGMGSNPIGNLITSFFGNPPTNFGTQDNVCEVSFDLPLVGTLQYSFRLSDWFPPAFRSCMLMILTIIFAIASAKAVSGAFQ